MSSGTNTERITQNNTKISTNNTAIDNFKTAIDNLPSGSYPPNWSQLGYENTPQTIIEAFDYSKNIKDTWNASITSMGSKYKGNKELRYFPTVDLSNVTSLIQTFLGCTELEEIESLNTTSNLAYMTLAFNSCSKLKKIPTFNISNVENLYGVFGGCEKLEDVPVFNLSSATRVDGMFSNCPSLSNESLNNIMESLISATNYTGTKTLAYVGLNSTQATTCTTLSNWTALQQAGWTTGY